MHPENREDEDKNPFPEDSTYQDKQEVKPPHLFTFARYEKIPIKIYGLNKFHLRVEATGNLSCRIPYNGGSLEDAIGRAMRSCRQNARAHLNIVNEGLGNPTGEEGLAERIIKHKDNLEDLFMLVYPRSCRKSIEKQLGRYSKIEKEVIDIHN